MTGFRRRGLTPLGGLLCRVDLCAVPHVHRTLSRVEPLGIEQLDCVCSRSNEPFGVLVRLEIGEHVVGGLATIATFGPAHADAEPEKVGRAEMRCDLNERLLEEVNRDGEIFISHTKLHGRFALRLAIGNLHTTQAHVARAWDLLQQQRVRSLSQ